MYKTLGTSFLVCFFTLYFFRKWFQFKKKFQAKKLGQNVTTVAFFHPYCNAGGGGERVLWTAVRTLQIRYPSVHCVIYTGDIDASKQDILKKAVDRFNINLPHDVEFIFLKKRHLIEAKNYPYFTLLLQSLASILLAFEALFQFVPDIYFDSMGYAFTFPIFKYLGSCQVGCYVHYPTISTDMLDAVSAGTRIVTNRQFIARSKVLTKFKLMYYRTFAYIYGFVGRRADSIMVNSSWTKGHIKELWKNSKQIYLVHPPCDVTELKSIPIPDSSKNNRILSIAQFRPEKDHHVQIKAFHKYLLKLDPKDTEDVKLILVGGCRSEDDENRVMKLKKLCSDLGISNNVEFKINLSFSNLLNEIGNAGIALHSMWNEHFGIVVVESMAAGQIIIAHDSGGPKLDIVVDYEGQQTGFLADSDEKYAETMEYISKMSDNEQKLLRDNARQSAERFSVKKFEENFLNAFQNLL